jgi:hypothetical protein
MPDAITEQPLLWRRPWWGRPGVAAAIWAGMVAYGSLMPFHVDMSHAGVSMLALSPAVSPPEDVMLNLALYVPLGVLLRLTWGGWWPAALAVVALSYSLECVQSLMPYRVAAWQDVAANAIPAIIVAALTPWLVRGFNIVAFACYRHGGWVECSLRGLRGRTWLVCAIVAATALPIGFWTAAVMSPVRPTSASAANWMPFADHFARSYDKAVYFLARSMLLYGSLAVVLGVAMMRRYQRRPLLWVALAVGLIACQQEYRRHQAMPQTRADVTEPILAMMAAAIVFTMAWLFIHAVRHACRRRHPVPVVHDRRRKSHDYRFALGPPDHAPSDRCW